MELALSLGDTPKPFCKSKKIIGLDLGFCMAVGNGGEISKETGLFEDERRTNRSSVPPVQLDLLPFSPVHRNQPSPKKSPPSFPWLNQNLISEPGINRRVDESITEEGATTNSSPIFRNNIASQLGKREFEGFTTRANYNNIEIVDHHQAADINYSRGNISTDEEENGIISRKKLRLSKQQSAFLEGSFKEHNTLNPKQKVALAKQLNLRPRQVEVWFQNRRARTKLKQTEVDYEYLKRWCETLTQDNSKLQKEVQELRALKTKPFYMQLPPTTLTMCPSCEKVVPTTAAAGGNGGRLSLSSASDHA